MYKGLFIEMLKLAVKSLYGTVEPGAAGGDDEGVTIVGDRCG